MSTGISFGSGLEETKSFMQNIIEWHFLLGEYDNYTDPEGQPKAPSQDLAGALAITATIKIWFTTISCNRIQIASFFCKSCS